MSTAAPERLVEQTIGTVNRHAKDSLFEVRNIMA